MNLFDMCFLYSMEIKNEWIVCEVVHWTPLCVCVWGVCVCVCVYWISINNSFIAISLTHLLGVFVEP